MQQVDQNTVARLSSAGARPHDRHVAQRVRGYRHRVGRSRHAGERMIEAHQLRADRRLLEIQLCDRAMGTSGAGTKQFFHQGIRYGHVIDPRIGRPSDGILSTTVIAPSAAVADALSTAFYVMGCSATAAYCAEHTEVSALITTTGKHAGTVELHRVNCDSLKITAVSP